MKRKRHTPEQSIRKLRERPLSVAVDVVRYSCAGSSTTV